ncbi:AAA domain-containing protein [Nocardia sp. alder85J]|uniref:AAA domain-containing protein n=1 Tax=Nocardia sp. alder85J TaxID=2862949 RepID=UPI001CD7A692|nr:AAA domain-containing protein [Nocardia sp. alder85J]MCX4094139.1 AAA domain-containing protein [Nocardia sp. alder85J]
MVDPTQLAVLIRKSANEPFQNRTAEVAAVRPAADRTHITFHAGGTFPYGQQRTLVLQHPQAVLLGPHQRILVDGRPRDGATAAYRFQGGGQDWWHIFPGEMHPFSAYRGDRIKIIRVDAYHPQADQLLAYLRAVAARLPEEGKTLREAHERPLLVHPDSALHRYLHRTPIEQVKRPASPPLYPFDTNLSQRAAIDNCLRHPISVIDGPPGTGKTQTILNLIANIIVDPSKTVVVVSSSNPAVDNVHTKLVKAGFGYVTANLGKKEKKEKFFVEQATRNLVVQQLGSAVSAPVPSPEEMAALDQRLLRLREIERDLADLHIEHAAYELERVHFRAYLERHELPDHEQLPVLRWRPAKILAFIADTDPELARATGIAGLVNRISKYFRYRSMRHADAQDIDVVFRLHQLYYDAKIAELQRKIERAQKSLEGSKFSDLAAQQQQLSVSWLTESLRQRYAGRPPRLYDFGYRRDWQHFTYDYPVILSTCHSLENSIGTGQLVDYLIIDEASQVDLVAAVVALAHCRNLIVVGDLRQLQPVVNIPESVTGPAPDPAYDYQQQSILSSLIDIYGTSLPRVLLREHYRSDPTIIGFCNQKFYRDDLIPFTRRTPGYQSMIVVRTPPGDHMRWLDERTGKRGGRINQREIDIIRRDVLPRYCAEFPDDQVGVTTPYRPQANRVTDALTSSIESDTVHKFQGREKTAIIMTTVLDSRPDIEKALKFADSPELINVAVSRARKRFILVTHHDLQPKSRNLRDLIGYIRYQFPDKEFFDSPVVSIFDLLYKDYSAVLSTLANHIRHESKHPSENIMRAALEMVLSEPDFQGFWYNEQVHIRHLLPDTDRLDRRQLQFTRSRSASVDFDLYNHITKQRLCVIEVDGFDYHENDPRQLELDAIKNAVCATYNIPILRFPTTGSAELDRLRTELAALIG